MAQAQAIIRYYDTFSIIADTLVLTEAEMTEVKECIKEELDNNNFGIDAVTVAGGNSGF